MTEAASPASPEDAAAAARRVGGLPVAFSRGDRVFRPGDAARGWIVVESGAVRVSLVADTGREITLYRILAGDSCILTTSALLSAETMIAEAVAETAVAGRLIPAAAFERLLAEDATFRRTVLHNYAERVCDLVVVIQDALFHAVPERLARLLLDQAQDGLIQMTHQALAAELGSAREVVTRILRRFEREGAITSERGAIRVLDAGALRKSAAAPG